VTKKDNYKFEEELDRLTCEIIKEVSEFNIAEKEHMKRIIKLSEDKKEVMAKQRGNSLGYRHE